MTISITSKEAIEIAIMKWKEEKKQSYPPTKTPIHEWQIPFIKEAYWDDYIKNNCTIINHIK